MKRCRQAAGVYAGSFDPVTRGHLDIISQAAHLLSKLYVVISVNTAKNPLFTPEERVEMMRHDIDEVVVPKLAKQGVKCDIEVVQSASLTAAFMKAHNAPFYVRGLRLGMEFDEEYPALVAGQREYRKFTPVFLCASAPHLQTVSSSLAREIERFNGRSIRHYVTPYVAEKLKKRVTDKGLRLG